MHRYVSLTDTAIMHLCCTAVKVRNMAMYNIHVTKKLGSVAGPLIKAERSMNASIRTELADSMVTLGEPGGD